MNFGIKLNLLKFKKSGICSIKGKNGELKKCIIIPIEDNHMFVSTDESQKAKGVFIDCIAWENEKSSKYGDTHSIRQSYPKEVREKLSADEKKDIPFIGNMKPYELQNNADSVLAPAIEIEPGNDDLPF